MSSRRVQELLGIHIPIIQAGMVWCSGWRLASAVSEAGGIFVELQLHCQHSSQSRFAVLLGPFTPMPLEMEVILKKAFTTKQRWSLRLILSPPQAKFKQVYISVMTYRLVIKILTKVKRWWFFDFRKFVMPHLHFRTTREICQDQTGLGAWLSGGIVCAPGV